MHDFETLLPSVDLGTTTFFSGELWATYQVVNNNNKAIYLKRIGKRHRC